MNRQDALDMLGLDEHASEQAVKDAFRRVIKDAHSDTGSGDGRVTVDDLVEAREAALVGSSSVLVPISTVADLIQAMAAGQVEQQIRQRQPSVTDKAVRSVVMQHVGRLAETRRRRVGLAVASGGIAALLTLLEATTKFAIERHSEGPETATAITITIGVFTVLAALVGLAAWSASSQEKMLELEIEGVAEAFEDKATIEDTLREVAESTEGFSLGHGWTREELIARVTDWLNHHTEPELVRLDATRMRGALQALLIPRRSRVVPLASTAHRIGAADFVRLLTTKGLERGVIVEAQVDAAGGGSRHGYRVA
jgi:hypothetical protein